MRCLESSFVGAESEVDFSIFQKYQFSRLKFLMHPDLFLNIVSKTLLALSLACINSDSWQMPVASAGALQIIKFGSHTDHWQLWIQVLN